MRLFYIGEMNEIGIQTCNYLTQYYNICMMTEPREKETVNCICYPRSFSLATAVQNNGSDTILAFISDMFPLDQLHEMIYPLLEEQLLIRHVLFIEQKSIFRQRDDENTLAKMLCQEYIRKYHISANILYTSSLYGQHIVPSYIQRMIDSIDHAGTLTPAGSAEDICDCLHIEDYCHALHVILEEGSFSMSAHGPIELQSNVPFPQKQLIAFLRRTFPRTYFLHYEGTESLRVFTPYTSPLWTPAHQFMQECGNVIRQAGKHRIGVRQAHRKQRYNVLLTVLILIATFAVIEFYQRFIAVASDLQYVDLRLLFVVFSSLVFGRKYGLMGAGAVCVASVAQRLMEGYAWNILFYNINNWVPLAIYWIVAIVVSKCREKLIRDQKNISEE